MEKSAAAINREREIYAVANTYIREHGEGAVIHAAIRADALFNEGDIDGQRVWLRVIEAIKVLSKNEKPAEAKIH